MLVYRGQVPDSSELDLPTLRGSFAFPIKYGYASVGSVTEVGGTALGFQVGDSVFVLHPHQDECVVPASLATRLPAEVRPELGVFMANLETAVNIALDAHPRIAEDIIVFGQGVVGLLLTQVLRQAGAGRIIVVDGFPKRRALALRLGASDALAPDQDIAGAVRSLTGGRGADLAIEVSGHGEALGPAIDSVAFQGTVVVASWYGTKEVSLSLGGSFHRGRVRLLSSQVGNLDPTLKPRWDFARRMSLARDLLGKLALEPLISHEIPFGRAAAAYDLVDRAPEETVQVVLTYGGGDD
jgi:2-desacetyl-2-hydroxyethyl bacteriochlorophyllide A dehydrogenase